MNSKVVKYYYKDSIGQTKGAISEKELKRLHLKPDTLIWHRGLNEWIPVKTLFPRTSVPRKLYWLIGTIVFLVVCSLAYIAYSHSLHQRLLNNSYYSEEFDIYLNKYCRDIDAFGITIVKPISTSIRFAPMQFFEDSKDYYGLCYGYENDEVIEIYINEDAWKSLTRAQKYLVMYHELSHDLLNVKDLPNTYNNQDKLMCPVFNRFESLTMDDFIERTHAFFEEENVKRIYK